MKAWPFNGKNNRQRRHIRDGFNAIKAGQFRTSEMIGRFKTYIENNPIKAFIKQGAK